MFDWLKNIFSPKPEQADDNLVEKQSDEEKLRDSKQEDFSQGPSSSEDSEK